MSRSDTIWRDGFSPSLHIVLKSSVKDDPLPCVLWVALCLTASEPVVTSLPAITSTTDPCARENISGEIQKVNDLMRALDDASLLASNTPREQFVSAISYMQESVVGPRINRFPLVSRD